MLKEEIKKRVHFLLQVAPFITNPPELTMSVPGTSRYLRNALEYYCFFLDFFDETKHIVNDNVLQLGFMNLLLPVHQRDQRQLLQPCGPINNTTCTSSLARVCQTKRRLWEIYENPAASRDVAYGKKLVALLQKMKRDPTHFSIRAATDEMTREAIKRRGYCPQGYITGIPLFFNLNGRDVSCFDHDCRQFENDRIFLAPSNGHTQQVEDGKITTPAIQNEWLSRYSVTPVFMFDDMQVRFIHFLQEINIPDSNTAFDCPSVSRSAANKLVQFLKLANLAQRKHIDFLAYCIFHLGASHTILSHLANQKSTNENRRLVSNCIAFCITNGRLLLQFCYLSQTNRHRLELTADSERLTGRPKAMNELEQFIDTAKDVINPVIYHFLLLSKFGKMEFDPRLMSSFCSYLNSCKEEFARTTAKCGLADYEREIATFEGQAPRGLGHAGIMVGFTFTTHNNLFSIGSGSPDINWGDSLGQIHDLSNSHVVQSLTKEQFTAWLAVRHKHLPPNDKYDRLIYDRLDRKYNLASQVTRYEDFKPTLNNREVTGSLSFIYHGDFGVDPKERSFLVQLYFASMIALQGDQVEAAIFTDFLSITPNAYLQFVKQEEDKLAEEMRMEEKPKKKSKSKSKSQSQSNAEKEVRFYSIHDFEEAENTGLLVESKTETFLKSYSNTIATTPPSSDEMKFRQDILKNKESESRYIINRLVFYYLHSTMNPPPTCFTRLENGMMCTNPSVGSRQFACSIHQKIERQDQNSQCQMILADHQCRNRMRNNAYVFCQECEHAILYRHNPPVIPLNSDLNYYDITYPNGLIGVRRCHCKEDGNVCCSPVTGMNLYCQYHTNQTEFMRGTSQTECTMIINGLYCSDAIAYQEEKLCKTCHKTITTAPPINIYRTN